MHEGQRPAQYRTERECHDDKPPGILSVVERSRDHHYLIIVSKSMDKIVMTSRLYSVYWISDRHSLSLGSAHVLQYNRSFSSLERQLSWWYPSCSWKISPWFHWRLVLCNLTIINPGPGTHNIMLLPRLKEIRIYHDRNAMVSLSEGIKLAVSPCLNPCVVTLMCYLLVNHTLIIWTSELLQNWNKWMFKQVTGLCANLDADMASCPSLNDYQCLCSSLLS